MTTTTIAGVTRFTETLKNICEEVILTNIRRQAVVRNLRDTDRWGTGRSGDFG